MVMGSSCRAGGFLDPADAWLLPALECAAMLRGERTDDPSLRFSLVAGQGRLFDLPELPQFFGSARWRQAGAPFMEVAASWQRTGGEIFQTDTLDFLVHGGRRPGLGLSGRLRRGRAGDRPWPSWRRLYARLSWPGTLGSGRWRLLIHLPLIDPPASALPEGRESFLDIRWRGPGGALIWVLERDIQGRPCAAGEMVLTAGQGVGLGLRWDAPSGALGLSLNVLRGTVLLRTSHLAHPRLGLTHRFSLGWVRP